MPQFVLSSHANDAKTMRAIVLVILTGIRAWTPSPRPRRCTALRAHPAFKQKKDPKYSLEAAVEAGEAAQRASVPQSFDDVLDEMGASVGAALDAGGARFLVEVLPPGLNPELEMTCPYDPSRELAVVQALLNAIPRRVIRVACPSAGDAAMAARALDVEGCSFCGLSSAPGAGKDPAGVVKRVFGKAPDVPDCVLVVRPRNSVGDPVIEDVMTCAEAAGGVGASVVGCADGCSVGCGVGASVRMNLHTQTSQQSPLLEVYAHTRQTKSALSPRTPGVVLLRVPAPGLRKRVVALPSGLVLLLVVLVVLVGYVEVGAYVPARLFLVLL